MTPQRHSIHDPARNPGQAEDEGEVTPRSLGSAYDAEGVDRSLIRWMLRLTPRERLEHLQGMIDLARSVRRIQK